MASLIVFIFVLSARIRRQNKIQQQNEKNFWERERLANSIRKKPLDGLDYIQIPLETFPIHIMQDDETVLECIGIMESLTSQKIVNLTGYSNTDLKLEYGTANITVLTEYDQNYTLLVRTLQKWADALIGAGHTEEAAVLMEFAIGTQTDISRTYYQLADYYVSRRESEKIQRLKDTAAGLRSSNRNIIMDRLQEMYPEI
ncbi:MAG: hypothetical protein NC305_07515 [Lachnospiraceae bacterium]|nr:hypothetical protein [Butyrivibrio sp.]MCM1343059.1 hypothetical protein [Muribaculaceae bacterium]MCM1410380.1 hypothetical protein [Lachnospiraceae bacterium]